MPVWGPGSSRFSDPRWTVINCVKPWRERGEPWRTGVNRVEMVYVSGCFKMFNTTGANRGWTRKYVKNLGKPGEAMAILAYYVALPSLLGKAFWFITVYQLSFKGCTRPKPALWERDLRLILNCFYRNKNPTLCWQGIKINFAISIY